MQIQVNTSNGINNKDALERWADAEIKQHLSRFVEDVTRVEVHLSDAVLARSVRTGGPTGSPPAPLEYSPDGGPLDPSAVSTFQLPLLPMDDQLRRVA